MESKDKHGKGMNKWAASFMIIAQMAGAGFLVLPKAFADTGWLGIVLFISFCVMVAFTSIKLGQCWIILEERWPHYKLRSRQPYVEIAYESYGIGGRRFIMATLLVSLTGTGIVFIIVISQFLHALIPELSTCLFTIIVSALLLPFTWLGTPKDFWQSSVLAVLATVVTCLVIFVQLLLDQNTWYEPDEPVYLNPTFTSLSLGFGIFFFSVGGTAVFPTIQNDMADRSHFWKSVLIGFTAILILYIPVMVTGYVLLGYEVPENILLYRSTDLTLSLKIAIWFEVINLLGTFLITFNPISQIVEEMLNIPDKFCIKRVLLRTAILGLGMTIALAFPDFGLIMNLIGGSTSSIVSFLAPTLMYMKLIDDHSNPKWPKRYIPPWERVFLYEIILIAIIGGLCSTGSALYGIIQSDFNKSCFALF